MKTNEQPKKTANMNYRIHLCPSFADPRDDFFDKDMGIFTSMERVIEVLMKYAGTTGVNFALQRQTDTQLGEKVATDPSDEEIDRFFQNYICEYNINTKDRSYKQYEIWCDYYDYQEDRQVEFKPEQIATFHYRPQHALDYFRKCASDRDVLASRVVESETDVESSDEDPDQCDEFGDLMDSVIEK